MIKIFCDICKNEIIDQRFSCEIQTRELKDLVQVMGKELQTRPQLKEFRYNLCKKCWGEKLNL